MKSLKHLVLLSSIIALFAAAKVGAVESAMSHEELLEQYRSAWTTTDADARLALLRRIWSEDGFHQSPYGRSDGIAEIHTEIEGFQTNFPDAVVTFQDIKRTGNHIICKFVLTNGQGDLLMEGIDYFEVNNAGQLVKVIGFAEPAANSPE